MARMGVDNLKANLTNPARAYLWEVLIPNVIGGGADTETLLLRAQSASIPGRRFEAINVPYKATGGVKYPGKLTFDHTWEVTFVEGEDRKIFDAFYNWCEKIVASRDGIGDPTPDIKIDIVLSLLTTKGEEYNKIKLIGAYPERIADVRLDMARSEVINFTITFSFDWVEKVE